MPCCTPWASALSVGECASPSIPAPSAYGERWHQNLIAMSVDEPLCAHWNAVTEPCACGPDASVALDWARYLWAQHSSGSDPARMLQQVESVVRLQQRRGVWPLDTESTWPGDPQRFGLFSECEVSR